MKKYNYEIVKEYFENNNCKLISTEYENSQTKLEYICSCGNIWKTSFKKFKLGQRCKHCRYEKSNKKRKISYEYVYNYFKEQECELLENEYINSRTPLKYKCICNNISYSTFDNFKNKNQRCKKCSNLEKHTYEYVKEYIESFGYTMLDKNYINSREKIKVKCSNNHIYDVSFNSFKIGQRCKTCYVLNNVGENNRSWKSDRTRSLRSDYLAFRTRDVKILNDDVNYNDYLLNKKLYEIDHIFPRIAFIDNDLDKKYDPKIVKQICNSRDNLRIILKTENSKKRAKYDQHEFLNWFNEKLNYTKI